MVRALRCRARERACRPRWTSITARTCGAWPGHGDGGGRFIESARGDTQAAKQICIFDLIVGTEEEFHIAGGTTDTLAALRAVRQVSDATLVCKRGRPGPWPSPARSPTAWTRAKAGPGFPIEVFNVLGAGDGFMSGPAQGLAGRRGLARRAEIRQCLRRLRRVAPRLHAGLSQPRRAGSSSSSAGWCGPTAQRPRAGTGPLGDQPHRRVDGDWSTLRIFAFDHRAQIEEMPGDTEPEDRPFKTLCLDAALRAGQDGQTGLRHPVRRPDGARCAVSAAGTGLWIGRPVEWPGSRPLSLEPQLGADCGGLNGMAARARWSRCLCFCHPLDDPPCGHGPGGGRVGGCSARAAQPPGIPARGDPVQGGRVDDDTIAG